MRQKKSPILKRIHAILIKRTSPYLEIEKKMLLGILCERVGSIPYEERESILDELKDHGMIVEKDTYHYIINKDP